MDGPLVVSAGQIHSFRFRDAQGRAIPVHYYIGVDPCARQPFLDVPGQWASYAVLFVLHGVLRNATAYLAAMTGLADAYKLVIIAPEFTKESFPQYNLGAVEKGAAVSAYAFASIE